MSKKRLFLCHPPMTSGHTRGQWPTVERLLLQRKSMNHPAVFWWHFSEKGDHSIHTTEAWKTHKACVRRAGSPTGPALHRPPRLPTPQYTFIINLTESFEAGTNEKGMHLLLDRWWGIWFDWCRRRTQRRSEPCGSRSSGAYAILFDWCGSRCNKQTHN